MTEKTGFAPAAAPHASTIVSTSEEAITAGETSIPSQGENMPAYHARPKSADGPLPIVIVVQEIFGVHEHIKDICRRLAKQGYQAIAPELYARQGDPRQYANIPDLISNVVSKVPDAQVMADLDACVAWAKANGGDMTKLGITGFCWGGRMTWLYAAHNPQVKAGVAWYGKVVGPTSELNPKNPVDIAGQLNGSVLGLYGGEDQGIPLDSLEEMRKALAASGSAAAKASTIHVYPKAPHAFHADYRPSYRKEEAEDGWKRLLAWFKQNGV